MLSALKTMNVAASIDTVPPKIAEDVDALQVLVQLLAVVARQPQLQQRVDRRQLRVPFGNELVDGWPPVAGRSSPGSPAAVCPGIENFCSVSSGK